MKISRFSCVIIGSLSIFVLFFSFVFAFVIFFLSKEEKNVENDDISREYKIYKLNSHSNESTIGIVSIFEQLEEDQYISYSDEENHILISNFGSTEYACSGNCYCETSETKSNRRKAAATLSRPIIYLLTAFTSILAYKKAQEYFEKECFEKLSPTCSSSSISSIKRVNTEIESCEKVKKGEDYKESFKEFFCKGNCLYNGKFNREELRNAAMNFGCESIQREGRVTIYFDEKEELIPNLKKKKKPSYDAKTKFKTQFLVPFCKKKSMKEYYKKIVNFCIGQTPRGKNPSVLCVETTPEQD